MSPTRACDQCGKVYEFVQPHSRFCSLNCRAKNHYNVHRWQAAAPTRTCEHCGVEFTPNRSNQRYHADRCRHAAWVARKRQQSS